MWKLKQLTSEIEWWLLGPRGQENGDILVKGYKLPTIR